MLPRACLLILPLESCVPNCIMVQTYQKTGKPPLLPALSVLVLFCNTVDVPRTLSTKECTDVKLTALLGSNESLTCQEQYHFGLH